MNKIPKYKSKNNASQGYIKVTKKESLDKNTITNNISINVNLDNSKKIAQKKLKFSNKNSSRKFGDDISTKIKNAISPNITHYHQNRKSLSNINEKVKINFIICIFFV